MPLGAPLVTARQWLACLALDFKSHGLPNRNIVTFLVFVTLLRFFMLMTHISIFLNRLHQTCQSLANMHNKPMSKTAHDIVTKTEIET